MFWSEDEPEKPEPEKKEEYDVYLVEN